MSQPTYKVETRNGVSHVINSSTGKSVANYPADKRTADRAAALLNRAGSYRKP